MEANLSIELDGGHHGYPDQMAHDLERAKYLTSQGIKDAPILEPAVAAREAICP